MKLQDRVAFVTGGGSGIGRAICQLFAREGATVVAADLIPERALETANLITSAGGVATGLAIDVADASAVKVAIGAALDQYGRIDILVNNAGLSIGDRITDFDEAMWDLNVDVVLKGVYLCSREVLPGMIERQSGVILNIGSINGLVAIGESAYSAAKAGMVNLTQNMAIHYGEDGVRVNLIAPGTIRTPIWDKRLEADPTAFDQLTPWYPLGRVGEPEDVAKAALFLCSDDASWITGVALPVDGGISAGNYRLNKDLQGVREKPGR
ncbi:MAG TPA: glucose 1-dehydrogenase [Thermomicrobiales bacterium]|nr:glucose 1-dehydrogenase [Thermomicrobiales bacterium]